MGRASDKASRGDRFEYVIAIVQSYHREVEVANIRIDPTEFSSPSDCCCFALGKVVTRIDDDSTLSLDSPPNI